MSNRCWATGSGTSYHEDRPLINGRLPSYATVRKAVFLHAVLSRAEVSRPEPKRVGCYAAINNSRQRCQATPVKKVTMQQGSEAFSRCLAEGL